MAYVQSRCMNMLFMGINKISIIWESYGGNSLWSILLSLQAKYLIKQLFNIFDSTVGAN
jgi:hypothetical protein